MIRAEAEAELIHYCRADDQVVRNREVGIIRCRDRWSEEERSHGRDSIQTALIAESGEYCLPGADVVVKTYVSLVAADRSGIVVDEVVGHGIRTHRVRQREKIFQDCLRQRRDLRLRDLIVGVRLPSSWVFDGGFVKG